MSEYNPRPPCNTHSIRNDCPEWVGGGDGGDGGACNGTIDTFTDVDDISMVDHVPDHGAWEVHDYTQQGYPRIINNAMVSDRVRLLSGVTAEVGPDVDLKATMLVEWGSISVFWFVIRWDGSLGNASDPQGQTITGAETYACVQPTSGNPKVFMILLDGSPLEIGEIPYRSGEYAIDFTMTTVGSVRTLTAVEQDTGTTLFTDSRPTEGATGGKSGLLIRGTNEGDEFYRADSLQVCQPEAGGAAYIRPPCDTSAPRPPCDTSIEQGDEING